MKTSSTLVGIAAGALALAIASVPTFASPRLGDTGSNAIARAGGPPTPVVHPPTPSRPGGPPPTTPSRPPTTTPPAHTPTVPGHVYA